MKKTTDLFSDNIFWDIDTTSLDLEQHKRFVIERVLTRGRLKDWIALNRHYRQEIIQEEATKIRYLDKVTLNFCSLFFNLPKSAFRCYTQPLSIQQLWQF